MSCAYGACVEPVVEHGVCARHLLVTYAAGRRSAALTGYARLTVLTAEMRES